MFVEPPREFPEPGQAAAANLRSALVGVPSVVLERYPVPVQIQPQERIFLNMAPGDLVKPVDIHRVFLDKIQGHLEIRLRFRRISDNKKTINPNTRAP